MSTWPWALIYSKIDHDISAWTKLGTPKYTWYAYVSSGNLHVSSEVFTANKCTNIFSGTLLILLLVGCELSQSLPTWMLGSWVRIPLKAWMFICIYSVFVCRKWSCDGLIPRTKSPTDCLKIKKLKWNKSASRMPYVKVGSNRNIELYR
jgi:hypothetical protein